MIPVCRIISSLSTLVRERLITLNLFDSRSTNPELVRRQILSTRFFIVLMGLSIFILLIYTSQSEQTRTIILAFPTAAQYQRLQTQYPDTLYCPCQTLSIPYQTYFKILPTFHQVCSSDFLLQPWIDFTFDLHDMFLWPMDVRTSLSAFWQLMKALCQSAAAAVNDELEKFENSPMISSAVFPEALLRARAQANLVTVFRKASNAFKQSIQLILRITLSNGFITGLSTNFVIMERYSELAVSFPVDIWAIIYIGRDVGGRVPICYCHYDESCPLPGRLYLYNNFSIDYLYTLNTMIPNATLPGLVVDCVPIQMILASSLECFYNQACLDVLLAAYPRYINVSKLDEVLPSRFLPTSRIDYIINELFVEVIFNETVFDSYYHQCAPSFCTYTWSSKFDWIYVFTTLIALFGGLNVGLRLLTPYVIDSALYLRKKMLGNSEVHQNESVASRTWVKNLVRRAKVSLVELNLFENHLNDALETRRGRIGTRLYLLLLTVSITVIVIYTFFSSRAVTKTIESPSLYQYELLQEQYPNTLYCPCSVISVPYADLMQIAPIYHQVCGSSLVQTLINAQSSYYPKPVFPAIFSVFTKSYFRTLSALCDIANQTIVGALRQFFSTAFINSHVLSRNLYMSQTNVLMNTFLNLTRVELSYNFLLINTLVSGDQYLSALRSNMMLDLVNLPRLDLDVPNPLRVVPKTRSGTENDGQACSCARDRHCNLADEFPDGYGSHSVTMRSVPWLYLDCFIVDSVLKSSLVCWYNRTCITEIIDEVFQSNADYFNVTELNATMPSRFLLNSTSDIIFDDLMVEQWSLFSSYPAFYQKCNPTHCAFTYTEQYSIIYIITTVISLCGGLSIALRWISFCAARILLARAHTSDSNDASMPNINQPMINQLVLAEGRLRRKVHGFITRLQRKLTQINLFKSGSTQTPIIQRERYSTRLYIFFLLLSVSIIILYTLSSKETKQKSIQTPSQLQYKQLTESYSSTLQCPCTQLSVVYKEFIKINASFHQVCTSDFIKDSWLDFLFGDGSWMIQERSDIRTRGIAYFTLLSSLCDLSKTTINTAIDEFLEQTLISAYMLPDVEFILQIEALTNHFKTITSNQFSHTAQLVRDLTHGSAYVSSYYLNWYYEVNDTSQKPILAKPVKLNQSCSCGTRNDCVEPGGIFLSGDGTRYFTIPGWNVGCSVTETLLRSTLECFYNASCIFLIQAYGRIIFQGLPGRANVTAMNASTPSRYASNVMIQNMVDLLFVEQWQVDKSYSAFYRRCSPSYCSYAIEERNSPLFILSRVLGLYGGLTISLRFIIPHLIRLVLHVKTRCHRNAVVPIA